MAMIPVRRMEAGATASPQAERVLAVALEVAEQRGWQAVSLVEVAARLDMPASEVLDHYRDLDAVANAWFVRGWRAMLAEKPDDFLARSARERLEYCLLAWLDALAGHRAVTVQMLRTKAHPPHPHTWVPMIFDLSRTVQWWREAARLEAPYGTHRARLEEVGLTALFIVTLWDWAGDDSPGQSLTRKAVHKRLLRAERRMQRTWGTRQATPAATRV